jgi:hypothetical protein
MATSLQNAYSQQTFSSKRYTTDGGQTYAWERTDILVHPKENNVTFTQNMTVRVYFINSISEIQTQHTETSIIQTITFYCVDKSGKRYNIFFSIGFPQEGGRYYSVMLIDITTKEQIIYL